MAKKKAKKKPCYGCQWDARERARRLKKRGLDPYGSGMKKGYKKRRGGLGDTIVNHKRFMKAARLGIRGAEVLVKRHLRRGTGAGCADALQSLLEMAGQAEVAREEAMHTGVTIVSGERALPLWKADSRVRSVADAYLRRCVLPKGGRGLSGLGRSGRPPGVRSMAKMKACGKLKRAYDAGDRGAKSRAKSRGCAWPKGR